jgi:hypothetical protein
VYFKAFILIIGDVKESMRTMNWSVHNNSTWVHIYFAILILFHTEEKKSNENNVILSGNFEAYFPHYLEGMKLAFLRYFALKYK